MPKVAFPGRRRTVRTLCIIARYALYLFREDAFRPWEPERAEVAQLRQLVARREQLVETRTAAQNRLQALKEDGDSLDFVIESVEKEYAHLDEQVREIDRKVSIHMDRHEGLKKDKELLTSIPGIGTTTAASWLAHLGDLPQLDKPSQIVAHIGIAPRERQSGSSVRGRPQICRIGIRELRKALYLPVVATTRFNPVMKAFYQRLLARGKQKKVALIACMNKLIHIIWAILKSRKPFDPGRVPSVFGNSAGLKVSLSGT